MSEYGHISNHLGYGATVSQAIIGEDYMLGDPCVCCDEPLGAEAWVIHYIREEEGVCCTGCAPHEAAACIKVNATLKERLAKRNVEASRIHNNEGTSR